MRIDHIAFRVADRWKAARFFMKAQGYRIQDQFTINFEDGTKAECIALYPPEKFTAKLKTTDPGGMYHLPPEIFISDGEEGSIVDKWVKKTGGGIHHIAYEVVNVQAHMDWAKRDDIQMEFLSEKPLTCPGIEQVFAAPNDNMLGNVTFEFIRRGERGFCKENVKALMESTEQV